MVVRYVLTPPFIVESLHSLIFNSLRRAFNKAPDRRTVYRYVVHSIRPPTC